MNLLQTNDCLSQLLKKGISKNLCKYRIFFVTFLKQHTTIYIYIYID